eukprot:14541305-Heterocapsa_arctica.AAC.1
MLAVRTTLADFEASSPGSAATSFNTDWSLPRRTRSPTLMNAWPGTQRRPFTAPDARPLRHGIR